MGSASIFDTLDNKPVSGTGALTLESGSHQGLQNKRWRRSLRRRRRSGRRRSDLCRHGCDSGVPSSHGREQHLRFQLRHWRQWQRTQACLATAILIGGGGGGLSGNGGSTATLEPAEVAVAPEEMVGQPELTGGSWRWWWWWHHLRWWRQY